MSALKVSYKDPAQLRPRDRNPRTHTPKQIKQIAASIKQFGFINPVLIDSSDGIIAGHGRVEAAKLLGMADIPTVCAKPGSAYWRVPTFTKLEARKTPPRRLLYENLEIDRMSCDSFLVPLDT